MKRAERWEEDVIGSVIEYSDGPVRLRDVKVALLKHASATGETIPSDAERFADRALQRMRKRGEIAYDGTLGWEFVTEPRP